MAEEKKKKGFWSWLGFGKKEEQAETVEKTEEPTLSGESTPPTPASQGLPPQAGAEMSEQTAELEEQTLSSPVGGSTAEGGVGGNTESEADLAPASPTQAGAEMPEQAVEIEENSANIAEEIADETQQSVETEELTLSSPIEGSAAEGGVGGGTESEADLAPVSPTQAGAEMPEQAVEIEENSANVVEEIVDDTQQTVETEELTLSSPVGRSTAEGGIGGSTESEADLAPTSLPQAGAEMPEQAVEIEENSANVVEEIADETQQSVEVEESPLSSPVGGSTAEGGVGGDTENETTKTQEKPSEGGFFSRLIKGLIKTKQNIGSGFRNLFRGKKIDDDLFEELEEQLLIADLGMPTTTKIINNLTQHATKAQLRDAEQLYGKLKEELANVLQPVAQPLVLEEKKPYVILMVGVNGVGKTTTIGKLARKFQAEGKSVMLAAGDTFRAAAVEQLQVWGERNNIPVIAQATGSDSASVIFDAMQSAAAKGADVLIADTAGRLQNKNNLMDELKKIVRVMKKYDETAPHEIMLTLDAGTGQNAISQAKLFNEAVGLTGITLTKLDGTAKGGVIFAIADQFNIPIRYIGVGEKIDDLRPFNADEFIEALFTHEDEA